MSFSLFFKPKHNYLLERIGKENDGGYLINSEAILKSDYLLSFGIFVRVYTNNRIILQPQLLPIKAV